MSKAFTKETDDTPENNLVSLPPSASLPPGTKNYLTEQGAARFRAELAALTQEEATVDACSDDEVQRRRKRKRRLAEIEHTLQSAEVVSAPPVGADARNAVIFGAIVTVREVRSREESQYQIVGVDEAGWGGDRVSLHSPIARALLNARIGERVRFRFPAGEEELEIVQVDYD